ncbi:MAG: hypothetical protein J7L22_03145 [Candidatus Marinimicrobia bacterium]|nr:hypothetical protein [Candidatus Neomarinimicrobiota bacterium]
MKIGSQYSEAVYRESQIDIESKKITGSEINNRREQEDFFQRVEERMINRHSTDVLSGNERTTLYMLFGSEKPEELNFYGRNRVNQIHKGQLIDLVG